MFSKRNLHVLAFAAMLLTSSAFAQENKSTPKKLVQQTEHAFAVANEDGSTQQMGYLLFLPKNYIAQTEKTALKKSNASQNKAATVPQKKWPLLVFLHGAGERGDDLALVKIWGPPKLVANRPDFPFVVLSPQCPSGIYWNIDHVNQLIDKTVADHRIDASRIYVSGLSMGGFGSWSLAAAHPHKFAAVIPICGGGDESKGKALTSTPIWAFHGDNDQVVPVDRTTKMVEAIQKAGGKKIRSTIYKGVNHNSWTQTFANEKIYDWLLSHKRN